MLIYLDESGDLGFDFSKSGTSKYFTITLLVCNGQKQSKAFTSAIRRTLKNKINRKRKRYKLDEVKAISTTIDIKRYFLQHAPKSGWGIYSLTIDKGKIYPHNTNPKSKSRLYNYLARSLLEKIPFPDNDPSVSLIIDKSKSKSEIKIFNQYIENQMSGLLPLNVSLNIYHEDSADNPCLQAVDLFCWGISRARNGDPEWSTEFSSYIRHDELHA